MQTPPLHRNHTPQRKLLSESSAELRNIVKVSVTIKVCCFLQKNIKNDNEYTVASTYRPWWEAPEAAALRAWAALQHSAVKKENWTHSLNLCTRINICLSKANPGPSDASMCFVNNGNCVKILNQNLFPNLFKGRFALWEVELIEAGRSTAFCMHSTSRKAFLKSWCFTFWVV